MIISIRVSRFRTNFSKNIFYCRILRGQMNYVNISVERLYVEQDLEMVLRK